MKIKIRNQAANSLVGRILNASSQVREIPDYLELEGKLEIQAATKADDGTEKLPEFEMLANTGVPMTLDGYDDPVIIDLKGASFDKQRTPIIFDHDTGHRLGHTISQSINDNQIVARGAVSSTMNLAQTFVKDARNGFPFQVSVGAKILRAFFVEPGSSATVNGQSFRGPLIVATKTRIRELSVTTLGADPNTSAKLAASQSKSKLKVNSMNFAQWLKSKATRLQLLGWDVDNLTKEQNEYLQAEHADEIKASQKKGTIIATEEDDDDDDDLDRNKNHNPQDIEATERKRRAVEMTRCNDIEATAKKYRYKKQNQTGLKADAEVEIEDKILAKYPGLKAKMKFRDLQVAAISEGLENQTFELLCMRADRIKPGDFMVNINRGGIPKEVQASRVYSCALQMNLNATAKQKNRLTGEEYGYEHYYKEPVLEAAHKVRKNATLHQIMSMCIHAATGMMYSGNQKSDEFIRATFEADRMIKASQSFSTLSVSNILEDVANKMLQSAYDRAEVVYPLFVKIMSLNDFKTHNIYRLHNDSRLTPLGPTGEIKHGSFHDQKYTLALNTRAVMIALSREMMINDDLSAFETIPNELGAIAPVAIESEFFVLLLSNPGSFFASGNGNIQTGAASDLDLDGVGLAEQTFSNQVDSLGNPILNSGNRLLVGTQDFVMAQSIYSETRVLDATLSAFEGNVHKGKYRPYQSPYINNTAVKNQQNGAAISGQDANKWYIFADPNVLPAFYLGFLNGKRVPTIESSETNFNTLGMQWRTYLDWGFGVGDPKGAVLMAGT